ncbi:Eco57I restriction-modification methylase domain-containing protein [Nonomuraea soli]|uniref:site-specific DNA-methyltransferase (adenine-specific) n=1 Tax=Nonomuraea soli TaxID=1032476 RepID=A0A7W0CFU8_9ACTN|nr:DNA methyltransferase [Nonomuraea soli]MBA2890428.1 hypothetical protein [Nonomuraea soli]
MRLSHTTITGGLFTNDLLARVGLAEPDPGVPGTRAADYHLAGSDRVRDAAARTWRRLRAAYSAFHVELDTLPSSDDGTRLTRERWLIPLLVELEYGRPAPGRPPISHQWRNIPIHLVGWHVDLDRRVIPGRRAPQPVMQQLLNSSPDLLWGILSNGRRLRLLRDSTALTGAAFIEFDLESIFGSDDFSEFLPFFVFVHQSRLEALPRSDGAPSTPADCHLERWREHAIESGIRFHRKLAAGVKEAMERLGTAFRAANPDVDHALATGGLSLEDYRQELLRLVYQLIFIFVAEDRGTLLVPGAEARCRDRYERYFSSARLRKLARIRPGDRYDDLWPAVVRVLDALGADGGEPRLALPGLGGLFLTADDGPLGPDFVRCCNLPNSDLLAAVRSLSMTEEHGRDISVDYRNLGAEELGSVYESLLELRPDVDPDTGAFVLAGLPGNERKTTGSFYTPVALIESLLESALDPILDRVDTSGNDPDVFLDVTVCDPACGSGHFLVAAARRIAKRHAAMYTDEPEPAPEYVRRSMQRIVGRCVYGVDANPLAVELAKVSLWMESTEPGLPLSFLDGHIKTGNSLLGAFPDLIRKGLPDEAFRELPGDEGALVAPHRARNATQRGGQTLDGGQDELDLGLTEEFRVRNDYLAGRIRQIMPPPGASLAKIRQSTLELRAFEQDDVERRRQKLLADAWCAAFVWPRGKEAPDALTHAALSDISRGKSLPHEAAVLVDALTSSYGFFHWYLEFPEIFPADGGGGFSCVLGNPPWERVKLQEKEWFAVRDPEIASARNAAERKEKIDALARSSDPLDRGLHDAFVRALRYSAGVSHFLRASGRYPKTGAGDINTYAVFAENARDLLASGGAAGLVLPTGIATDATTAPFFGDLVRRRALSSFLEFENEEFLLSRDVHHSFRFCLLTISGIPVKAATVAFGARRMSDLDSRSFVLPPEEILLVNPNTGTLPLFRSPQDARITFGIYRRVPVLIRNERMGDRPANPWRLSFQAMFHMANDSSRFHRAADLEREGWALDGNHYVRGLGEHMLPLYEAKMVHHYDHRWGTYLGQSDKQAKMGTLPRLGRADKDDPECVVLPRYWVPATDVEEKLGDRWDRGWLLGWRDICRATDERTLIAALIPQAGIGHTFPLALAPHAAACLYANFSALVLDYVTRQKIAGTHLTYGYLYQLPVLPPEAYEASAPWQPEISLGDWINARVLELIYTTWDMAPFAADLGDDGPPFRWNEERRFELRCELDAAYFHLYGLARDEVEFVLDSFGAFRRNDPARFARTAERVLDIYDSMAGGPPYTGQMNPPPGKGARHPARPDSVNSGS